MISNQASQSTSKLELNTVLPDAYADGKIVVQGSQLTKALAVICKEYCDNIVRVELEDANRVIEYEPLDQVISVETGIKIDQLNQILGKNNQYFPCSGNGKRSLLDAINSGDCGHLEHSNSGMRSLVLGLTVMLTSGEVIKTGGKVVKNVSGYDLTKLFVGSRGTLGLPVQANLRLFAKPQQSVTMAFAHKEYVVLQKALNRLLRTGLSLSACEFLTGDVLAQWSQGAVLVMNIAEHKSVIAELIPQIESFLLVDGIEQLQSDEQVFAQVEDMIAGRDVVLETSLSQKQFAHLEPSLKSRSFPAHYRPRSGRFRILANSGEDVDFLCDSLRELASVEAPLLVAVPGGNYEYYVHHFPDKNESLNEINHRIKRQFDPENRLNPYASL